MEVNSSNKKKRLPPYLYDRAGRKIRVITSPRSIRIQNANNGTGKNTTNVDHASKPSSPNSNQEMTESCIDLRARIEQVRTDIRKCEEEEEKTRNTASTSWNRAIDFPTPNEALVGMRKFLTTLEEQLHHQQQTNESRGTAPAGPPVQTSPLKSREFNKSIAFQVTKTPNKYSKSTMKTHLWTSDGKRIRIVSKNIRIVDKSAASES